MNLENVFRVALEMAYLGIIDEGSKTDSDGKVSVFFSVPETTDIRIKDNALTHEDLLKLGKSKILISALSMVEIEEEFIQEFEDSVRFYGKVRVGEHWTEEMGIAAMTDIKNKLNEYKEV